MSQPCEKELRGSLVVVNRVWAMPHKNTFKIKPIGELVERYVSGGESHY